MFGRKQATSVQRLAEISEAERLRLALAASGDCVYDWTPGDGRIRWYGDPSAHLGFGDAAQFQSDKEFHQLIEGSVAEARLRVVAAPPADGSPFRFEYALKTNGAPVWVEECGVCIPGVEGEAERVIGALRNITERKTREDALAWAASYDEMTGHLNRLRLREHLALHLENVPGPQRKPAAYFVAAIDDLAIINEAYGFDTADEVIVAIGRRLAEAAGPNAVVGRTAGNKFGLIVPNCAAEEMEARSVALRAAARTRVVPTRAGAVSITVSVGAIALPQDARSSQEAMARAEESLDRAKAHGRDNYAAYVPSPQRESLRKRTVQIGDQIISALSDNRVVLAYQSIVDTKTAEAVAHECLVRLTKDDQIIAAGDFVPVAEQLGLVRQLDRRVLELTIATLKKHRGARLSMNVSGMTASDGPTLEAFATYLEGCADVAPRLIVELTETAALLDIEESMRFVSRVRALGAQVAIDDFGAGYTSFRNLQTLKVDMVKVDGSFVKGLADSRDNQIFVRTLVDLAKNFNLTTVAEWVGDQREVEILRAFGVDYLQGFFFSKPEVKEPWIA